jgi:cystathionine beta-lyase/cystathionine gamma-synthase
VSNLPKDAGPQTRAIHAGEAPDDRTGASSPNIVMSTTFKTQDAAAFSIKDFDGDMPYIYTRWGNPTIQQLQEKLRALEGAESCLAFASGMAATSALLLGYLSPGDHLIVSDVQYAGSAELVRHTLPRFGIEVTPVDTSEATSIADAMRDNTKLVFIETPINPILRLADIEAISAVCRVNGTRLAVDSTFASPIVTRPIELGADFVIHSLTKYIGGHGDALGGALLGPGDLMLDLNEEALVHYGGVISPFNAWLIMRGIATLPIRMQAHSLNALQVAEFLESHPAVKRVNYPGLRSHPQHDLALRQMSMFSGMLSFQVDDGLALATSMIDKLRVIHYAVSLGHHRSLAYWIGTDAIMESSYKLEGRQREAFREFAGEGVIRLSVGLEDADDLCRDLDSVLSS